jgi:hypothetical protein
MLKLKEQVAAITSVNLRTEKHGDKPVPACDIGIHFDSPAKVLDSFEKGLSEAMYAPEADAGNQTRVPGTGDGMDGPRFRFNGVISAFKIKKEWPGYKAKIEWGDIATSLDMDISDIKVCKIQAEPKDGGTCGVSLQMQCHPQKDQYGDLALINGRDDVRITLSPPSAAELKKLEKAAKANKDEENPED